MEYSKQKFLSPSPIVHGPPLKDPLDPPLVILAPLLLLPLIPLTTLAVERDPLIHTYNNIACISVSLLLEVYTRSSCAKITRATGWFSKAPKRRETAFNLHFVFRSRPETRENYGQLNTPKRRTNIFGMPYRLKEAIRASYSFSSSSFFSLSLLCEYKLKRSIMKLILKTSDRWVCGAK